jgi:hypothetical protein
MLTTHRRPLGTRGPASLSATLLLLLLVTACDQADHAVAPSLTEQSDPRFTVGTGTQSSLLGRGTFAGPFKVKREWGEWEVEVEAKPSLDVAVQKITFLPNGQSGWHTHPGPVFIQVLSGEMTFYESNVPGCVPIRLHAGQGYLDTGEHAHIARNETALPAENLVVYFAPSGAALRIDAPDPGHCPF